MPDIQYSVDLQLNIQTEFIPHLPIASQLTCAFLIRPKDAL